MKKAIILVISAVTLTARMATAQSEVLVAHNGATDPATEGFSTFSYSGVSTVAPVAKDLGLPAWSIVSPDNISTQFGFVSGELSDPQKAEIGSRGFTLTLVARVLPGHAPAFSASTPFVTEVASVSPTQSSRYDIDLALDRSGNTVVVLPSIIVGDSGSSCAVPSSNLTVTVPGNGYHTYQLTQSPSTGLADLYVDGVDLIKGYGGTFCPGGMTGYGLLCVAANGGEANFNLVQLSAGSRLSREDPITRTTTLIGAASSSNQLNAATNPPGSNAPTAISTMLDVGIMAISVHVIPAETVGGSVTDRASADEAIPPPNINSPKAVYLTSSNLWAGLNFQVQTSVDLIHWTDDGSVYTATNSNWQSTNSWDVTSGTQLFFRLHLVP